MTYQINEMFFEGFTAYRGVGTEWGDITVGGDRGDVHIDHAACDEDGVRCTGLTLSTSEDLTPDEAEDLAREIVDFSYSSVGGDTFIGNDRW